MSEMYEENLRNIYAEFGRVQLILLRDAADFLGVHYRSLLTDKKFPVKTIMSRHYVAATALARWLS